jgi:hypothetical protein
VLYQHFQLDRTPELVQLEAIVNEATSNALDVTEMVFMWSECVFKTNAAF